MKFTIVKLLLCIVPCCAFTPRGIAQQGNVWVFGKKAGIDFNSGVPIPMTTNIDGFGEGCASVCDENGQLLFFTEGSKVWDKNGILMNNGTNLTPVVSTNTISPTSSTSQGVVVVPFVMDKYRYFIFSLTSFEQGSRYGELYYSVVDMRLNNGRGEVVVGQKGIFMDSSLTEQMTAITGDRCNVWLLVCTRRPEHKIKAYEITETGIRPAPVVSNGFPAYLEHYAFGSLSTSPDRKRIAIAKATNGGMGVDGLALFDFDPVSGSATNYQQLSPQGVGYGVCFSPDGQKLYFDSYASGIYQYDLSLNDINQIINSRISLSPAIGMARGTLKLGPDARIYFRGIGANGVINGASLSRINSPNNVGASCFLEENALPLIQGTSAYLGLPAEVPVLLLDTLYTSQTLSAGCFADVNKLQIQPNNDTPGWDYLWNTGATTTTLVVDTPGTYWITYRTPPCNFHTDTFQVGFPNGVLPNVTVAASCFNSANGKAYAATYPGDTVRYHYLWQNQAGDTLSFTDTLSGVRAGTYTLRVRTVNCDTNLSFFIPEVDARVSFGADSIVCRDKDVVFDNTSDPHFQQFQWDFGDKGTSLLESPAHSYPEAGSYRVSLIGIGAICRDTTTATITVDPRFFNTFRTTSDSICIGEVIVFSTDSGSPTLSKLYWQFGDGAAMTSGKESKVRHA